MLAKIEAELSTAAGPAEEQWIRQRGELIRGLLAPQAVSDLGEALRRDRLPGHEATALRPWGMAYIALSTFPPQRQ